MAPEPETYLAVLRVSYDYEPQPDAEEELAIKENQLLLLLERTDDDWWKVKIKPDTQDEDSLSGLVPSAYVEPAEHISVVKALFDYEAVQPGELTIQEDEILHVFSKEDEWLLVQSQKEGGTVGYIPGNYVEETTAEGGSNETSGSSSPPVPDVSTIVIPDSPPKPAYTDPQELVSRSKAKAQTGTVETWSVSEVDKKSKKKKGTLGVGNGAMFFASEADKTPVQKWQTVDIISTRIEKNKHVHIEVGGASPISLHFHVGSKDVADAIIAKLEESRPAPEPEPSLDTPIAVATAEPPERPRSSTQKSVHFDSSEPVIIPPREDDVEVNDEDEDTVQEHQQPDEEEGERAVVLYDFTADGDDEMTVHEGETLLVLERDTDEWWKCRNAQGDEGVVPANYLEAVGGSSTVVVAQSREADERVAEESRRREREERREREREEAERKEKERKEKERKKAEAEQRAKAAAAAAETDRQRREQEREKQREKEKERERAAAQAAAEEREQQKKRESSSENASRSSRDQRNGRSSTEKRAPPSDGIRTWHDRTGQFRVDAAFLGFSNGKLRLHKVNGVIIEVPQDKMSAEDLKYAERVTAKRESSKRESPKRESPASPRSPSSDEEPLELRRRSLQPAARAPPQQQPKKPTVDWFEFFLGAGCDVDDCSRYAQSFERDKIDEAILPDITESTMRSLGLREGDIIRVKKAIAQKHAKPNEDVKSDQLRRDEELARRLQAEESVNGGPSRGTPPNLFASGPNGALKQNVRRGRPQPSRSGPPSTVDIQAISSASDQIRTGTPVTTSPSAASPARPPSASATAAAPVQNGFDDDAWTNRPSSTKPIPPSSPANARPASVPPAAPTPPVAAPQPALAPAAPPAPPAPPVPPVPAPSTSAPPAPAAQPSQTTGTGLANKTEADIFDQLARLAALKPAQPPMVNRPVSAAPTLQPSFVAPPVVSLPPPPLGYQTGLGMGNAPGTLGQHLQAQQTGYFPPQQPLSNGARGPLAPIPANQSLLQPLVPTNTGFNSFVPTRPQSAPFQPTNSSFLSAQPTGFQPQPTGFQPQPTGFQPQPTSFQPQPTGFQPQTLMSQPTGFQPPLQQQQSQFVPQATAFQPSGPLLSQPTGLGGGNFGTGMNGGLNPLPPFQNSGTFSPPIQTNPTGFNPGFGQFNSGIASPPPPAPPPAVNTNPANVFAQMKSGTFGQDDGSTPQSADKYNALRPGLPLTAQSTGWNNGFQGGFTGGYGFQR